MNITAKVEVLEQLIGMARLIRKRGTPEKAIEVAPYEIYLQKELDAAKSEQAKTQTPKLPGLQHAA